VSVRATLAGLKSFVSSAAPAEANVGGVSARYGYAVWMRHVVCARDFGLTGIPEVVAELGPGNALGVGIAALLCGASRYYALDVVAYTSPQDNVAMVHELVELLQTGASIPDAREFPEILPQLENYAFPRNIVTEAALARSLRPKRVEAILAAFREPGVNVDCDGEAIRAQYSVPWNESRVIERNSVDFLVSQAAMEHVEDLRSAYKAMMEWLKPGGITTHQVDFRCHYTADEWNGHWAYNDLHWRVIKGKRPYLLNREALSGQLRYAVEAGFEVLGSINQTSREGIGRDSLAKRFRSLSDLDLETKSAFIALRKPAD